VGAMSILMAVVRGLTMGQYVEQAEKVPADSLGGRHDGRQEEKGALVVVVLAVVELLLAGGARILFLA
jgi:hypothetical protein